MSENTKATYKIVAFVAFKKIFLLLKRVVIFTSNARKEEANPVKVKHQKAK